MSIHTGCWAHLQVSQSMRFFWYEDKMPASDPAADPNGQSRAHLHIIPRSQSGGALPILRSGELVISGRIVQATVAESGKRGAVMRSYDSGNGGCELLILDDLGDLLSGRGRPEQIRDWCRSVTLAERPRRHVRPTGKIVRSTLRKFCSCSVAQSKLRCSILFFF